VFPIIVVYLQTLESKIRNVDYAKAFSDYLLTHGMNPQQLDALIQALQ